MAIGTYNLEILLNTIFLFLSCLIFLIFGLMKVTYVMLAQMVQYTDKMQGQMVQCINMLLRAFMNLDWQLYFQNMKDFFVAIGIFIFHNLEVLWNTIFLFLSGLMSGLMTTAHAMLVQVVQYVSMLLMAFMNLDWQLYLQNTKEFFTFIIHNLEVLWNTIFLFLSDIISQVFGLITAMAACMVDIIPTSATYKKIASGVSMILKVWFGRLCF